MSEVGEILWKYKLSPETTNLPARNGINEIQVFEIALKTPELDEAVLQAMDRGHPVSATLSAHPWRHTSASLRLTSAPAMRIRRSGSLRPAFRRSRSRWTAERPPLPVALDLAGPLRANRSPPHPAAAATRARASREHVARFRAIEAKKRERQQLEAKLEREKQFNRKVELNAALRSVSHELENLKQL